MESQSKVIAIPTGRWCAFRNDSRPANGAKQRPFSIAREVNGFVKNNYPDRATEEEMPQWSNGRGERAEIRSFGLRLSNYKSGDL